MDWEETVKYVRSVIEKECADAGVSVEITDPELRARTVAILRSGRRRYEAKLREEHEAKLREQAQTP